MTLTFHAPPIDARTWAFAAPLLQSALDRADDGETLATVRADIDAGIAQLWTAGGNAAVTRRCGNTLDYWLAAGNVTDIERFSREIGAIAKFDGCTAMTITGRPGWARALPGWRTKYLTLERSLA